MTCFVLTPSSAQNYESGLMDLCRMSTTVSTKLMFCAGSHQHPAQTYCFVPVVIDIRHKRVDGNCNSRCCSMFLLPASITHLRQLSCTKDWFANSLHGTKNRCPTLPISSWMSMKSSFKLVVSEQKPAQVAGWIIPDMELTTHGIV